MGMSPHVPIKEIEITEQGVLNLLTNHEPHKSPGPDDIGASFLRNTATEIAPMLTHLFQQSLSSGVLPLVWKHAYLLFIRRVELLPCFTSFIDMQGLGSLL